MKEVRGRGVMAEKGRKERRVEVGGESERRNVGGKD